MITDPKYVKEKLPEIRPEFHKYDRGRLLMVCGSYGMAGALILAAKAALRTGTGYLDLALPERLYPIVTAAVPEAVCSPYDEKDPDSIGEVLERACGRADAVVLGCGLGELRRIVVPAVLNCCERPLLIDADGLNQLSESTEISFKTDKIVMTPHEGELARLLHTESTVIRENREECCRIGAQVYHAVMVLKGPSTLISETGRETFVNPTGNAGLARAGSGDVLSGIIGSLMAQGAAPLDAAVCGVYLHGLAGDMGRQRFGIRSLLPGDLTDLLPEVLKSAELW